MVTLSIANTISDLIQGDLSDVGVAVVIDDL